MLEPTRRVRLWIGLLTAAVCAVVVPAPVAAQVLLHDDFDGVALDTALWTIPTGPGSFFGRTQIRPPGDPPLLVGGVARLRLDSHNPSALVPGDSFLGAEIDTVEAFAPEPDGTGIRFSARLRLVGPISGGLVGALFSFAFLPAIPGHDEIDFELLSNDVVAGQNRVLTNVFDDADFSQPGAPLFAVRPGLDLTRFHEYAVSWYTDRVIWSVDGSDVRVETEGIPDAPQSVRLNLWAPDASFALAYDAALVPAAEAAQNETWFLEVDEVEVARLPAAAPAPGLGTAVRTALALTLAALVRIGLSARSRRRIR